jgi:protein-S-isoprenylcysteine O-methyltransferase Ste14
MRALVSSSGTPGRSRFLSFPPLLYFSAFAAGLILHWIYPVQALPAATARVAAAVVLIVSVSMLVWCRATLARAGTTMMPHKVATAFTVAGPYRWTRNPMCLSMAGLYLGAGLLVNALAPLILVVPVFMVVDLRVIRWEERHLAAKFGAPYLAYKTRVRRWL